MEFTLSENEICNLTGYSHRHLHDMRMGCRTAHKGLISRTTPLLKKGKDWEKYGWAILYAMHVSEMLLTRKTKTDIGHHEKAVAQ